MVHHRRQAVCLQCFAGLYLVGSLPEAGLPDRQWLLALARAGKGVLKQFTAWSCKLEQPTLSALHRGWGRVGLCFGIGIGIGSESATTEIASYAHIVHPLRFHAIVPGMNDLAGCVKTRMLACCHF